MRKLRWRKENSFGKLTCFRSFDLIPVYAVNAEFCDLFQLLKLLLAILLSTEAAYYTQTPKGNVTTTFSNMES